MYKCLNIFLHARVKNVSSISLLAFHKLSKLFHLWLKSPSGDTVYMSSLSTHPFISWPRTPKISMDFVLTRVSWILHHPGQCSRRRPFQYTSSRFPDLMPRLSLILDFDPSVIIQSCATPNTSNPHFCPEPLTFPGVSVPCCAYEVFNLIRFYSFSIPPLTPKLPAHSGFPSFPRKSQWPIVTVLHIFVIHFPHLTLSHPLYELSHLIPVILYESCL